MIKATPICNKYGVPNAVVTVLKPNKIQVVVPGVTNKVQIEPMLRAFDELALGMEIRTAMSMSGSLGKADLQAVVEAAGVAMAIVWGCLILRYFAAGVLGLFLCVVYIWLHLIFFNASSYALSDAAIVAVVLNIGLGADAHIIAFERCKEDLHTLPRDAPRELGLQALQRGLRIALITVLKANVSTMLAMVVLYGVGTGATVEFAFTVIISVCANILINMLLARLMSRLAWNAELITTGGFFEDKGPAYDEQRREKFHKMNKWVLIPYWTPARRINADFIKFWWIGAIATMAVIIAGSLNWGVDYSAGTTTAMIIPPPYDYTCEDTIQGHVELRFKDALEPKTLQLIVFRMGGWMVLGGPIVYNEYTVDNTLAVEQSQKAIIAMVVSAVVTCAFVLLRFGPGFAISGFLSLASAGLFAICCFAMGGYEVNLPIIDAILTVFSYAINDVIVVDDRIRLKLKVTPPQCVPLLTLAVVLVCAICLVGMGPEGLVSFSLAITFGLLNATCTTILICAPFWYLLRKSAMAWSTRRSGAPATPATPAEGPSSDAASLAKLGSASSASFRRVDSASIKESVSAGSADLRTASVQGDSPRS
ncbi:pre translocase subunit [Micractinium conductrix]|uniref:Pre translocase subunit n=1 Tax=Micractinium conductrix TaxID=554055 RepID=A0A2P6VDE4_9CHLO|nr:pre translocase subunit [Micractinium conductrix]|eukprot:PSC72120.1 pre translocase subunit [Micractinium conductrix]